MQDYRAPRWLVGGNPQTIWPALFAHASTVRRRATGASAGPARRRLHRRRLAARRHDRAADGKLLVLFHGLEGSSASRYAQAFAGWAQRHGWHFAVPHFRGCSGELNLAPRAYHSGDFEEIDWILATHARAAPRPDRRDRRLARRQRAAALGRGGRRQARRATVDALCAVSAPLDLAAGGRAIGAASTGRSTRACSCAR